jgi:hypothetical protein
LGDDGDQLERCVWTIQKISCLARSGQTLIALGEAIDAIERICNDKAIGVDVSIGLTSVCEDDWNVETDDLRMWFEIDEDGFRLGGYKDCDNWNGLTGLDNDLAVALDSRMDGAESSYRQRLSRSLQL